MRQRRQSAVHQPSSRSGLQTPIRAVDDHPLRFADLAAIGNPGRRTKVLNLYQGSAYPGVYPLGKPQPPWCPTGSARIQKTLRVRRWIARR